MAPFCPVFLILTRAPPILMGSGLELKAIAGQFGLSYTGVSRRVSSVAKRMEEDKIFRAKINNLLDVKVKT